MSPSSDRSHGFLWTEEGQLRSGGIAQVVALSFSDRVHAYTIPSDLEASISVGTRVEVPLGSRGRFINGIVISVDHGTWASTHKPIRRVLPAANFLSPHLIQLAKEVSSHYCARLGATLEAMSPESARRGSGLRRVSSASITDAGLKALEGERGGDLTRKREALLRQLIAGPVRLTDVRADALASSELLRVCRKLGWIEVQTQMVAVDDDAVSSASSLIVGEGPDLTDQQQAATDAIDAVIKEAAFRAILLYGVSGSGKTEVYVRAIQRVITEGRQALLLVPEIMLTTQLVERLVSRFGGKMEVHHSGNTDRERARTWRRIASGACHIVVGTRSAVFAPFPSLGLICVDEEQESSYKNLRSPRYHVRDVAIMRAKLLGIPVVLGSATPSLEIWNRALTRPDYLRISMPQRVRGLSLPKVTVVDMRLEEAELGQSASISRLLRMKMTESLAADGQVMILMNRRGLAARVLCQSCGESVRCPNCSVSLAVHAAGAMSRCHYCRSRVTTPTRCPDVGCRGQMYLAGMGTQRVERDVERLFPGVRILRADSDSVRARCDYENAISKFANREIDILVGTQMIAKGLDFPGVRLVGIIGADQLGMSADFRAQERLFQLLTQAAGRAGRFAAMGEVVMQTMTPKIPAVERAAQHDFEGFAAGELEHRRKVGLPPFGRLARIIVSHSREETARSEAEDLSQRILKGMLSDQSGVEVQGPERCVLARLRGKYRFELIIQAKGITDLRRILGAAKDARQLRTASASCIVDVDPVDLS